jgi:hypothetical protein
MQTNKIINKNIFSGLNIQIVTHSFPGNKREEVAYFSWSLENCMGYSYWK